MSVNVAKQTASTNIGAMGGQGYGTIPGIGLSGPYTVGAQHEYDAGIDIRVTPASGGFIVSVNHRNIGVRPDLHIVTEDKDLGAEIGKIITMSCLKKE
jgi:hypothetical protein